MTDYITRLRNKTIDIDELPAVADDLEMLVGRIKDLEECLKERPPLTNRAMRSMADGIMAAPKPICCWKCNNGRTAMQMILCPECGNKRCPKASDHTLACTSSNAPGQPGSVY